MPIITTIDIGNPRLVAAAYDFRSVTEHKDLPRKTDCIDDGGGPLWSTDPNFPCQVGCGDEKPFAFIVEPGDTIPLQFQITDLLNSDPENPTIGWKEATGPAWLQLEVVDMNGGVLWTGATENVSDFFEVGYAGGSYQTVVVDVDKLLALLPEGTTCWSFKVKIANVVSHEYTTVNNESADGDPPIEDPPIGYTYIDFGGTGHVLMWNGTTWEDQGVPHGVYYVVETGIWYEYKLTPAPGWVGLAGPPDYEDPVYEYAYTMNYRLRRCDEPVVKFCSTLRGRDCLGMYHEAKPPTYLMDPINGVLFVDYWVDGGLSGSGYGLGSVPVGTTILHSASMTVLQFTADGWQPLETLDPGDQVLVMNDSPGVWYDGVSPSPVSVPAGTVFEVYSAWVPFSGWWDMLGPVGEVFPGVVFVPGTTPSEEFQLCFGVGGSLEKDEFGIQTTVTRNGRRVRTIPGTRARLRTVGVPEHVAQLIQLSLSATDMTVNGEAWANAENIRKNNDEGAHWWIDTNLSRNECEVPGSCD